MGTKQVLSYSKNVYVPNLVFTLLLVSRLVQAAKDIRFDSAHTTITHSKGHIITKILLSNSLYWTQAKYLDPSSLVSANIAITKMLIMEAHKKLGHVTCSSIRHMINYRMILSGQ